MKLCTLTLDALKLIIRDGGFIKVNLFLLLIRDFEMYLRNYKLHFLN